MSKLEKFALSILFSCIVRMVFNPPVINDFRLLGAIQFTAFTVLYLLMNLKEGEVL